MRRNNKNVLIAILLAALAVMAVAYAAFSTALSISGTSTIKSSWNVGFDTTKTHSTSGVVAPTIGKTGGTTPSGTVSYTDAQHASIVANLYQPGDIVVFTLTIKNTGSLAATLGTPTISNPSGCSVNSLTCTSSNGYIKFTVGSPAQSSLAASTGQTTIQITAQFMDVTVSSMSANQSASITVGITATQS